MTDEHQRSIIISMEFAKLLGISGRCRPNDYDPTGQTGIVDLSVDDLSALAAHKLSIDWGEPDSAGRYSPTLTKIGMD